MENKTMKKSGAMNVITSLVAAYALTGILLLVLALLLYKMDMDESKVSMGIIAIYILSSFLSGFLAGKRGASRKFLWGLLTGSLYFALLVLMSMASGGKLQIPLTGMITTFAMCAGGGMAGGMIS